MSSYQVLARKWRPHDFESIVGQDHVVTALTRALTEGRLHHAYLFTGTRGVGKTTISRIFAKALNCQGADGKGGVTAHPCGVCEACRAIDEGRFVDYIEMDAASNRSVEDMTQLLERAMYAPTEGRFKVYMIDEVHMLSSTAFNAMLKTLEEPPEYVKFILATTDPQKVPVTVLSRCLQFTLRNMTPAGIVEHLEFILGKEGIEYERPGLRLIAEGARGSMRDALSLLDQAIAFSGGKVTDGAVRSMLGLSSANALSALLRALAAGDAAQMIRLADEMVVESVSFGEALRGLAAMLHKIAFLQRVKEAVAADDPEYPELAELAALLSPEEVQLYYQIALTGRNDLALAPDEYAGFTMALLRMLAFKPAGLRNVPPQRTPEPVRAALSSAPQSAPTPRAPQAPSRPTQSLQAALPPMMEEPPPFIPDNPGAGGGEPRAG
ncbi:DNA polymerase III subunit gamma/tau [Sutterella wadsworthensis]|uniref:DNA polymerase III subunit gamma/tau n=1 Tax=Sutterella wadsworthensis TaxID=40545 RepID=UPI001C024DB3|nr:DNA polymerase III subunit gamma/tau [Sutterella wadsworthensis]MBT9621422.1 DNA polymerase III subunit gamma/tau [Sutterella wadsworthensis]